MELCKVNFVVRKNFTNFARFSQLTLIMIKVGLIGYGVIGSVLAKWLLNNNPDCKLFISDPQKGHNDNISDCDIYFVSIHIENNSDGAQDLQNLKNILENLPSDKPIFIRSTIAPGTTDALRNDFSKNIYYMPEFLTERTAYEDFCKQSIIFCGETALLKQIFKGKKYEEMTSLEAEIAKYAHNVFGALKVTFFNGIYEIAKDKDCDYEKIKNGFLLSGYINDTHTHVPGPDGQLGYGGKCFPKDVNAFLNVTKGKYKIEKLIKVTEENNQHYRNTIKN